MERIHIISDPTNPTVSVHPALFSKSRGGFLFQVFFKTWVKLLQKAKENLAALGLQLLCTSFRGKHHQKSCISCQSNGESVGHLVDKNAGSLIRKSNQLPRKMLLQKRKSCGFIWGTHKIGRNKPPDIYIITYIYNYIYIHFFTEFPILPTSYTRLLGHPPKNWLPMDWWQNSPRVVADSKLVALLDLQHVARQKTHSFQVAILENFIVQIRYWTVKMCGGNVIHSYRWCNPAWTIVICFGMAYSHKKDKTTLNSSSPVFEPEFWWSASTSFLDDIIPARKPTLPGLSPFQVHYARKNTY